jgi:hypothetical protein
MLLSGAPGLPAVELPIIRSIAPLDHYNRMNPTLNLINLNAI